MQIRLGCFPDIENVTLKDNQKGENQMAKSRGSRRRGRLHRRHPNLGALILECTNLAPFSADIGDALGLPGFSAGSCNPTGSDVGVPYPGGDNCNPTGAVAGWICSTLGQRATGGCASTGLHANAPVPGGG